MKFCTLADKKSLENLPIWGREQLVPHVIFLLSVQVMQYRAILVVSELGWVDLYLRCSLGWWAATVVTYCPSRMVEHLKMKSTQPNCETTRITLYVFARMF